MADGITDLRVVDCSGGAYYDHDYDIIAEHTSLSFPSVWVAPRGDIG